MPKKQLSGSEMSSIVQAYIDSSQHAAIQKLRPMVNVRYPNLTEPAFRQGFPAWKIVPRYSIRQALRHLYHSIKFKVLGHV